MNQIVPAATEKQRKICRISVLAGRLSSTIIDKTPNYGNV